MMTEVILAAVCQHYGITRQVLTECSTGKRQVQKIVEPKQTAAHLLWRLTRLTNDQIANILGYKSKTNIIMCRRTVKEIASGNRAYADALKNLEAQILRD